MDCQIYRGNLILALVRDRFLLLNLKLNINSSNFYFFSSHSLSCLTSNLFLFSWSSKIASTARSMRMP